MTVASRKPRAFVAVPCGDFYAVQAAIIREVADVVGADVYVAEDDPGTKGLWDSIRMEIDNADIFIADISSRSPNILLEAGYAIARKPVSRIGLFLSQTSKVPSDLQWLVMNIYSGLPSFRQRLTAWFERVVPLNVPAVPPSQFPNLEVFTEDFMNEEFFQRRWSTPPGCSYLFAPEGLRFSNAHFPILTKPLAILLDCEFEFDCRIEGQAVGWVVKGTQSPTDILPTFCVMFNLDQGGLITPHVWSAARAHPTTHYQVFAGHAVRAELQKSRDGWITLCTRVRGDVVEIENGGRMVFAGDLATAPYSETYGSISGKGGQVGFRCHPGEVALVRRVRVRAL